MNASEMSWQAMLAQAAYANFAGVTDADGVRTRLRAEGAGFSAAQADAFLARFEYVQGSYYDDLTDAKGLGTGLQLSVFREKGTGQLHLAIRGTEGSGGDFVPTDAWIGDYVPGVGVGVGVGVDQIVALNNWWLRVSGVPGTTVPQNLVLSGLLGVSEFLCLRC